MENGFISVVALVRPMIVSIGGQKLLATAVERSGNNRTVHLSLDGTMGAGAKIIVPDSEPLEILPGEILPESLTV